MENRKDADTTKRMGEQALSPRETRFMRVRRVANFIWLMFGILEGLIGLRILLRLLGANPANPFAKFIYNMTEPFLVIFNGLVNDPSFENVVFEVHSVIALAFYALVTWVIVRLVWLIFYRPEDIRS